MAHRPYNNNFVMNFWGGEGGGLPPHNKLYFIFIFIKREVFFLNLKKIRVIGKINKATISTNFGS